MANLGELTAIVEDDHLSLTLACQWHPYNVRLCLCSQLALQCIGMPTWPTVCSLYPLHDCP